MRMSFKHGVWILTLAVGMGIGGATLAVGSPLAQDHDRDSNSSADRRDARDDHQDYSKNRTYQQGVRDGRYDHARNWDHSRKRHFKRDQDRRAYEAGYRYGHDRR
jgi:hypothetical protein